MWLPPFASYSLLVREMYSISEFWPSTATSKWLPIKWRHFRVTSVTWSRDVFSCHVTAFYHQLQPCRKWNVQYTGDFGHLQQLPGELWSNNVTSWSLPVTWGHVTSFPVMSLPPPASYSLVGSKMYRIQDFLELYLHFQVTSGQMTSLPGHFRSPEVRDFISCHVTASSCELQPYRKWNVQYKQVFGLLEALPGNFRSNDVTSGSLPVTCGHVMSFPVTWLPPPPNYSLVESEMYSIHECLAFYSHFLVTSGRMTSLSGHLRSRHVIICDVTAPSCELQPCRIWNVEYTLIFGLLQALPGDFRSNYVTSGSLSVTWGH